MGLGEMTEGMGGGGMQAGEEQTAEVREMALRALAALAVHPEAQQEVGDGMGWGDGVDGVDGRDEGMGECLGVDSI